MKIYWVILIVFKTNLLLGHRKHRPAVDKCKMWKMLIKIASWSFLDDLDHVLNAKRKVHRHKQNPRKRLRQWPKILRSFFIVLKSNMSNSRILYSWWESLFAAHDLTKSIYTVLKYLWYFNNLTKIIWLHHS